MSTTILVILAIPIVLWAMAFALRAPLMAGCLVYLFALNVLNTNFYHLELGPYTLTIDRIVFVLLVGMFVVQWRLGRTAPKPLDWGDYALFAFVGWLVIRSFAGEWQPSRPEQAGTGWRLLVGYLIPLSMYWIARQAPLDKRIANAVLAALAGFGVYLAVLGILEIMGAWNFVWPPHVANPKLGIHFGRARGPTLYGAVNGFYLTAGLLALLLWRRGRSRPAQLLAVMLIPLFVATLYFTYTRMVWVGAGAALFVFLTLVLRGVWRPFLLTGALAATLVVTYANWDQVVALRRDSTKTDAMASASMRIALVDVSWRMFLDHPLMGCGFGQYPKVSKLYLSDTDRAVNLRLLRDQDHHINVLSLLVETGLIGAGLYLLVLGNWVYTGWDLCRRSDVPPWAHAYGVLLLSVLAAYVCHTFNREMTYGPEDHPLLFLVAGISVGLRAAAEARVRGPIAVSSTTSARSAVSSQPH